MSMDTYGTTRRGIALKDLVAEARSLASPSGENPEYDRALVELIATVGGRSDEYHDDPTLVSNDILGRGPARVTVSVARSVRVITEYTLEVPPGKLLDELREAREDDGLLLDYDERPTEGTRRLLDMIHGMDGRQVSADECDEPDCTVAVHKIEEMA